MSRTLFASVDIAKANTSGSSEMVISMYIDLEHILDISGERCRIQSHLEEIFRSDQRGSGIFDYLMADHLLQYNGRSVEICCREGKFAEAWDRFGAVVELARLWRPAWEYHFSAYIQVREGHWEEAENTCRRAISLLPDRGGPYFASLMKILERTLRSSGQWAEAEKIRQELLDHIYAIVGSVISAT